MRTARLSFYETIVIRPIFKGKKLEGRCFNGCCGIRDKCANLSIFGTAPSLRAVRAHAANVHPMTGFSDIRGVDRPPIATFLKNVWIFWLPGDQA